MDKKGHWYTDKNGHHYFVEDGQSPKEGWEESKRRKMISGGKYKVSEDGDNWEDVDEDTYNKYEADKSNFDETTDDDFGFDEEENMPEYEYSEIFSDSADKQIERYAEHYGVDASELKDEIYQKALDKIREGDSLSNARNDAMEEVLDSLDPGNKPLDDTDDYKVYEDKIRDDISKVTDKQSAEYVSDLIDNNLEAGYITDEKADELYAELDKMIDKFSNEEYNTEMKKAQEENAAMSENEPANVDALYRPDEDKGQRESKGPADPNAPAGQVLYNQDDEEFLKDMGANLKNTQYGRQETLDEYYERVKDKHTDDMDDWKAFISTAYAMSPKEVDRYIELKEKNRVAKAEETLGYRSRESEVSEDELRERFKEDYYITENAGGSPRTLLIINKKTGKHVGTYHPDTGKLTEFEWLQGK